VEYKLVGVTFLHYYMRSRLQNIRSFSSGVVPQLPRGPDDWARTLVLNHKKKCAAVLINTQTNERANNGCDIFISKESL